MNEIVKRRHKPEEEKSAIKILKHLINPVKKLLKYLMIILKLHLRLNIDQFIEKG